jgi:hypothetical protein
MALTPELARTIIKQAREDETYEGPVPEDDEKAISEAEGLIRSAEEAWAANIKGPEVEALLRLAAEAENGDGPAANGDAPAADADPEPAGDDELEQPIAAYDALKSTEIIANLTDMAESERPVDQIVEFVESIQEYEAANKNRKGIIAVCEEIIETIDEASKEQAQAPDPEPDPEPESDPEPQADNSEEIEKLAKVEPWEDYSKEKVNDIVDALEFAAQEDEDWEGLAMHVWAYESTHKDRKKIMATLEKLAGQGGGSEEDDKPEEEPPAAEAGAGDTPDAAASDDDTGGEASVPQGEADSEGDRTPDREADAGAEAGAGDEPEAAGKRASADAEAPADPVDGEEADLHEEVIANLERERLHVPPPIEADQPEMPFDLTTVSDSQLRHLHGAFAAYAYRAGYLQQIEEAKARNYKERIRDLEHTLLVNADKTEPQTGKPKTMGLLEAEIASDETIRGWRKRQVRHEEFAASYKSQKESYHKYAEILSRQETMRQNEFERAGGGRKR